MIDFSNAYPSATFSIIFIFAPQFLSGIRELGEVIGQLSTMLIQFPAFLNGIIKKQTK